MKKCTGEEAAQGSEERGLFINFKNI